MKEIESNNLGAILEKMFVSSIAVGIGILICETIRKQLLEEAGIDYEKNKDDADEIIQALQFERK